MLLCMYIFKDLNDLLNICRPVKIYLNGYTMGTTYSIQIIKNKLEIISRYSNFLKKNTNVDLKHINKTMSTYNNNTSISILNKKKMKISF